MPGKLFVVATPIGNLGDITVRSIDTLASVGMIVCEDTRRTVKLLNHLQIHKPLLRYDEHVHERVSRQVLSSLWEGTSIALVTDAGTPSISDPGSRLVEEAVKAGIEVTPLPGPSSVISALSASGFHSRGFIFIEFLPRRPGRARRQLQEAFGLGRTVALLESPFRVAATIQLVVELVPQAQVVVAREMTKIHEEFIRGDAQQVLTQIKGKPLKGEVVILIHPEPINNK